MNFERIFQLAGAIVGLATVTVILTSPQTGTVIRASTEGFARAIRAAMDR